MSCWSACAPSPSALPAAGTRSLHGRPPVRLQARGHGRLLLPHQQLMAHMGASPPAEQPPPAAQPCPAPQAQLVRPPGHVIFCPPA